ncbi:MAG TPA: DJ-1/PfpI family protein [Stellaceae bacterium]|nr:DJ-1/PfpI family protein [Stellaceae bacterium]
MTRRIVLLAPPGFQLLDVSGPLDVFSEANAQAGEKVYALELAALHKLALPSSSGIAMMPDIAIGDVMLDGIDTLLVSGAPKAAETKPDSRLTRWLLDAAPRARRFGSICSGAFFLAATGLLDQRRITTHWAVADRLVAAYPAIIVERDAIHVRDGRLRTAAGVTAGLDLALSLVEEDLGREIAMDVAAQLVMYFRRPGGQMQFSRTPFSRGGDAVPGGRSVLQEIQRWVTANPGDRHDVPSLAARAGMSARHFSRLFHVEIGVTPAAWVEATRVAVARRLLEDGAEAPKQVARHCGFANADVLRRAFLRHVGVTPAEYRRRFAHSLDIRGSDASRSNDGA